MASKTIYTLPYRELVQRLRLQREALGLTQTDVARRLGWPQQRLSAVEAGARRLDVIEFIELASQLDLDLTELLTTLRNAVVGLGSK
ncbi:helix-turn-helix domain-containing protein [Xanthomonas citri]|uniref:helix-turn-helix domain-containing protein n=1 Tax=Xanthomonas citri TaxID=346 RepID=UPI000C44C08C|nr:helix-turn-helix transcriptional regulator [Xanthomonas citri]SOO14216.1 conserved hypothetical protein [Xanthomonas citri pv. fuscans]